MNAARQWIRSATEVGEVKGIVEWLRVILDGNRAIQIFEMGPRGHLVGTDYHGNKYYENRDMPYNRQRWVIYADKNTYNPTSIPPEWHGWINYINDYPPTKHEFRKPIYEIEATVSTTGHSDGRSYYQPKGAWVNPERRSWLKYQAWQPPSKVP